MSAIPFIRMVYVYAIWPLAISFNAMSDSTQEWERAESLEDGQVSLHDDVPQAKGAREEKTNMWEI